MHTFFLIICILWTAIGIAQEPRDRAISFYAIKDYQKAREIYEGLLVTPLPPWEKAFLLYNIGTTLMAEGKWTEARNAFDSVVLGKDPSPLLVRYLKTNLGVDTLRQAYALTLHHPYDADKVIWLLNDSLKDFQEAYHAECDFEALGSTALSECLYPHDLSEMNKIASQLLFEVNLTKRKHLMQSLKSIELIYLLIEEVERTLSYTTFLKRPTIASENKVSYANLFYEQGRDQLLLWERIGSPIKDSFVQGLEALKAGDIERSSNDFENTLRLLKAFEEKESKEQFFEKLLFRYKLALAENPLDIHSLQDLQTDQQKLLPTNPSNELLQNTIRLVNEKQDAAARFFLQGALGALSPLQVHANMTPESILQNLINGQKQSLLMSTLFLEIPQADTNAVKLLRDVQKAPLNAASAFIDASLTQQRLTYQKESQCQWNLWGTVFPLFEQGFSLGTQASQHLAQSPPDTLGSLPLQDQAIKKWEEALNSLHNKQKDKEEAQQASEPIPPAMQNTINSIEEMDLQDAIPQPQRQVKTEEGIPPW